MDEKEQRSTASNENETVIRIGGLAGYVRGSTEIVVAIGALAGALGSVWSGVQSNERVPYALAFAICVGLLGYLASRRFRRKNVEQDGMPADIPHDAQAVLRFLLPFDENDLLPGRSREVQYLATLLASRETRFLILCGESGCGKTSLSRAGLIQLIRNSQRTPIYVPDPTNEPIAALCAAVSAQVPTKATPVAELVAPYTSTPGRTTVIFDQFEEFFLARSSMDVRTRTIKALSEFVTNLRATDQIIFVIRSDFLVRMRDFAPYLSEPMSVNTLFELKNLTHEEAAHVFRAAQERDHISFDTELTRAIIQDLDVDGTVRPTELQVVATRLKQFEITTVKGYEKYGRATGLLSSYIGDQIRTSPNSEFARKLLRAFCAESGRTRIALGLTISEMKDVIESQDAKLIEAIAAHLINARLVLETDPGRYNLVHDFLVGHILRATANVATATMKAHRLLSRYLADSEDDPRVTIPWRDLKQITKFASPDRLRSTREQRLISRSNKRFVRSIFYTVAFALLVIALSMTVADTFYGWREIASLPVAAGTRTVQSAIAFQHSGHQLGFISQDESITVFDCDSGGRTEWPAMPSKTTASERPLFPHDHYSAILFAPHDNTLVAAKRDGVIVAWDRIKRGVSTLSHIPEQILSLGFSEDGNSLFAICEDGSIQRFNLRDASLLATVDSSGDTPATEGISSRDVSTRPSMTLPASAEVSPTEAAITQSMSIVGGSIHPSGRWALLHYRNDVSYFQILWTAATG